MSQYVLIPTLETQPDESIIQLITLASVNEVRDFIDCLKTDELVALDLETHGLYPRYHRDQLNEDGTPWYSRIVAYGLHAESIGSVCVDLRESYEGCALALTNELLRVRPKLVGHNCYFDWMQLAALYNPPEGYAWQDLPWHDDTYILFKLLATEGWVGQRHGLKEAQQTILDWYLRGDAELSEWLKARKLKKSDMWQAPFEILGRYCALDCQSTFLLYKHLKGIADRWKAFEVLRPAFMSEIRCLIQNYFSGIPIDRQRLEGYVATLTPQIEEATKAVFAVPEVKVHVEQLHKEVVEAHPEPKKFTQRELKEPPKFKKDGKVTIRWQRWKAKMDQYVEPEPSSRWLRWRKNMDELEAGMLRWGCAPELFNLESPKQMLHLVYTVLNLEPVWTKDKAAAKKGIKQDKLDTSKNAYGSWGAFGKAVAARAKLVQRQNMSLSWLSNTNPETNLLHPLFKVMGTTTTRLSGSGGVNVQNPVKDKEFLDCIREPEPDKWVWVDADFCYEATTEVLTKDGWKTFDKVTTDDYVWQVNKDSLEGSWVHPSRVIWRHFNGTMFVHGNKRGELHVTENHTMLFVGQQTSKQVLTKTRRYVCLAQDVPPHAELPVSSFSLQQEGYVPDEKTLWLSCMLQADGEVYNKHRANQQMRIQVSIPRKRAKVAELLGRSGKVSNCIRKGHTLFTETWHSITFTSPIFEYTADGSKRFNLTLLATDQGTSSRFLEALTFWDGSIDKGATVWGSTDKHNTEEVQRYFVRCGYECKMSIIQPRQPQHSVFYQLRISKSISIRVRPSDFTKYEYDGMVGCVTVPEGFIMVRKSGQTFVCGNCALESVLMAFVSQDDGYLSIYGPDAKPEDIYLFFGGHIPGIKEKLAQSGYYPGCADKEAIKRAKKEHKELRGVAKAAVLAFAYGCGKKTFFVNMTNKKVTVEGKPITRQMCDSIFDTYWATFKGLKAFNQWCEATWERTGGYVLSPVGLPVAACSDKVHKTPNHCIQMLGHCMCMLWLMFVEQEMDALGFEWYPVIYDFHDETSLRVRYEGHDKQAVIDASIGALKKACERLNAVMCTQGSEIPMKVDGAHGVALTAFKIEE